MLDLKPFRCIYGWLHDEEGQWLYKAALPYTRVLEIGAWHGRSTYCLLSALRDNPSDQLKIAVSVDQYKMLTDPIPFYSEVATPAGRNATIFALKNNIKHLLSPIVSHVLLDIPSVEAYPALRQHSYGLAFIDGDHSYPAVHLDITECLKLVEPGGIICGHDYKPNTNNEGVVRAVDELLPDRRLGPGSLWYWKLPLAH